MTAVEDNLSADGPVGAPPSAAQPRPNWVADLLHLERDGDRFRATFRMDGGGRLFGGLVAAQALAAAGATVGDGKEPQSLHAYFVRAGLPDVDVDLEVERVRDGRSFDTRRVTASQAGEVILEMLASFHLPEPATDWHPPVTLAGLDDAKPFDLPGGQTTSHFEMRSVGRDAAGWMPLPYWIRLTDPARHDPLTSACVLTFMSDMGIMAAAVAIPGAGPATQMASLDHSVWFHRPFHPERWHQYDAVPVNGSDSTGLAIGAFHDTDGRLVATITQEALRREPPA